MKIYEIDGERFSTLEEFYDEVHRVMRLASWGRNLDAFNDILRGGFGTPEEGFTIRWKNHKTSKERLGYGETARQLEMQLGHCHSTSRFLISKELENAKAHRGSTVFDWLVEIIRLHGRGAEEQEDAVDLLLQ
jgi:RNAse (barnase) inhibitor barstar